MRSPLPRLEGGDRPFGVPGDERRVSFRLLHILEFRDGKISRENVWVDAASILQQLG